MDLRRLRAGEWVAAISGAGLVVSLFLPWYRYGPGASDNAWEALAVTDVLLGLLASFGVGLLVVTAAQRTVAVPIALSAITTLAGLLALLLVLLRLLFEPDGPGTADATRAAGVWLGLASAVGLTAGGWLAMRDDRLSGSGRPTDATGRPAPPPPEIEPVPPPPAEAAR
jgi:hypothetical protein